MIKELRKKIDAKTNLKRILNQDNFKLYNNLTGGSKIEYAKEIIKARNQRLTDLMNYGGNPIEQIIQTDTITKLNRYVRLYDTRTSKTP